MWMLLVGGLLALPALLLLVLVAPLVAILAAPALYVLLDRSYAGSGNNTATPVTFRHAVITGGSSGIGLAVAEDCVRNGFDKITILARNVNRLNAAKEHLQALVSETKTSTAIQAISVDVSNLAALSEAAKDIIFTSNNNKENDKKDSSVSTHLFCCAGTTEPAYFEDLTASDFITITNTNQLGVQFTIHAFLPYISRGTICLVSSMGGQVGVFGYAAYCPTKFALRGLAECLHMELLDKPIAVQIAFPPDTDTPCFARENVGKPEETRLISETARLAPPHEIAKVLVKEAMAKCPRFAIYFDVDGWMLSTLTAGFSPVSTLTDALSQIGLASLLRFVALFYLQDFWRILQNYQVKNKRKSKQQQEAIGSASNSKESEEETEAASVKED